MKTICSEKGKQDMALRRMKGAAGTYQALSSPTTSMETSSAQAVLTSQHLAGRKGEKTKGVHRREKIITNYRSDQLPTPRYMDWYTKQQQQQKELLLVHFHISDILDLIRVFFHILDLPLRAKSTICLYFSTCDSILQIASTVAIPSSPNIMQGAE